MLLTKYCRQLSSLTECPGLNFVVTRRSQLASTKKECPGLNLELDEGFQVSNCFTELIRGNTIGAVDPT